MSAAWPRLVTFIFLPGFWLQLVYVITGDTGYMFTPELRDGLSHAWGSAVAKDI